MLRYSRISLVLLALFSYWEGSDAVQNMDQYDEADDDYFGVPLSVAEWCSGVYKENGEYETLFATYDCLYMLAANYCWLMRYVVWIDGFHSCSAVYTIPPNRKTMSDISFLSPICCVRNRKIT